MPPDPDDITALVATLSVVTNLNKVGLGALRIVQMLRSHFGMNLFRKSATVKNAERLLAADTTVEEQKHLTAGEYDLKEYKLLRDERLRRIKKAINEGNVPLRKEDLADVDNLFESPKSDLALAASDSDSDKTPFEYVEQKRIRNIKNVTREAVNALPGHAEVSETPVDDDWVARFFENVKDVSNEGMQKLWGKLLAGEVAQPGNVSLRTLDVLHNLSSREARLFAMCCQFCTRDGMIMLPAFGADWIINNKYTRVGINHEIASALGECGLLRENMITLSPSTQTRFYFARKALVVVAPNHPVLIGGYKLTQAGHALRSLTDLGVSNEFLDLFCEAAKHDHIVATIENM